MSSLKEKWCKLKNNKKNKWGNIDSGGLGVEKMDRGLESWNGECGGGYDGEW